MTTYLPRSAWTRVAKPSALAAMPARPVGIAVHWPGTTAPIGHRTQADMAARLEGYRRFHVSGRGWTDIAYQVAVDQDGRVWDLRGIEHESAANGDQSVNLTYLACLLLLGPGEQPSDAMRRAFTDWRRKALATYPTATRLVGHRDIRPHGGTDCPGPITEARIKAGTLLLTTEDDMPDPKDLWNYDVPRPGNTPISAATSLGWANVNSYRAWQTSLQVLAAVTSLTAMLQEIKTTGGTVDLDALRKIAQESSEAAIRKVAADVADGES